jgi:hypothetical protein
MPTRDSRYILRNGQGEGDLFNRIGVALCDDDGAMKREALEILEIVKKYDVYLATGHLSPEECLTLCKAGRGMGVKMIMTHPDWKPTTAPLSLQLELASMGVLVEKLWANVAEGDVSAEAMAHSIREIGPDHVFIATDRGQAAYEKPVQGMQLFIETLLERGFSTGEIKKMVRENPGKIVER